MPWFLTEGGFDIPLPRFFRSNDGSFQIQMTRPGSSSRLAFVRIFIQFEWMKTRTRALRDRNDHRQKLKIKMKFMDCERLIPRGSSTQRASELSQSSLLSSLIIIALLPELPQLIHSYLQYIEYLDHKVECYDTDSLTLLQQTQHHNVRRTSHHSHLTAPKGSFDE